MGKVGAVPNESEDIVVDMKGLPKNISFKRPSLYGMRQLQTIISHKSKFEMCGKFEVLVVFKVHIKQYSIRTNISL